MGTAEVGSIVFWKGCVLVVSRGVLRRIAVRRRLQRVGRNGPSFYQVDIPVASTSRRRGTKTEDQRKWVHEVWVGCSLANGVGNTVDWDAQRWAYFCQRSNERNGRDAGTL